MYLSCAITLLLIMYPLLQMALIPRTAQGHGWLRPAVGVVELSQCIAQVLIFGKFATAYHFKVMHKPVINFLLLKF